MVVCSTMVSYLREPVNGVHKNNPNRRGTTLFGECYSLRIGGLIIGATSIPVVPHKAVAEVSEQETYRRGWLL